MLTAVFIGILSCLASNAGYVIVIPLAALIFMSIVRHPIAGLATGVGTLISVMIPYTVIFTIG